MERRAQGGIEVDVAIVGAGLAGLVAARRLRSAGAEPIVLEARDRVGGRTFNHILGDGQAIEAGGEFVGPTQDRVLALAKSVGVGTYKAYNTGDNVRTTLDLVSTDSSAGAADGADLITAGLGNDTVLGGGGADSIAAGDGADILVGDNGQVLLTGGIVPSRLARGNARLVRC